VLAFVAALAISILAIQIRVVFFIFKTLIYRINPEVLH